MSYNLPFSITHNFIVEDPPDFTKSMFSAICKYCGRKVTGTCGISSNFVSHVKKMHPDEFDEYRRLKPVKHPSFQIKTEPMSPNVAFQWKNKRQTKSELPFSISHNYIVKDLPDSRQTKFIAICKYCDREVIGSISITSNFIGHLKRKHTKEFEEYVRLKPAKVQTTDMDEFDHHLNNGKKSKLKITDVPFSITQNYIIKELPHSITSKLTAACKYCGKSIKTPMKRTSNFITHIKRMHPVEYDEYIKIKEASTKKVKPRKSKHYSSTSSCSSSEQEDDLEEDDENIDDDEMDGETQAAEDNQKFNRKTVADWIVDYIINSMKPPSEVENDDFKIMINGITSLTNKASIPTSDKINEIISEQYSQIKMKISDRISSVDYFSTTTSILCCGKQIFIGMCLHWINEESFEQETAMLCCRRFKDQLIPEVISAFIADVYLEFDIASEKVIKTTINGDLNKINAISLFDPNPRRSDFLEDDPLIVDHQEDNIKLGIVPNNSLLTYSDTEEIFKNHEEHGLPPYHKCCSYLLNLLVAYDTAEALLKEPLYLRKVLESTFAKCAALFTKINSSNEFSRLFHEIVDEIPNGDCTRWSYEYNLLNILNRTSNETLTQALLLLELDNLMDSEYQCLQEYTSLLKPMVEALNRFENEKFCFYGEVAPVLYTLKAKIQNLHKKKFVYCNNMREALIVELTERFSIIFGQSLDANDALLAAISNPFFKRRWIKNDEVLGKYVTDLLISTAESMANVSDSNEDVNLDVKTDIKTADFFDFDNGSDDEVSTNDVANQISNYLDDKDTSYAGLNNYPVVRNIFFLTNTTLPSTVKTDRIFAETVVKLGTRGVEWEENILEKQLYCKYNRHFLFSSK